LGLLFFSFLRHDLARLTMKTVPVWLALLAAAVSTAPLAAREARLVRYPHYHQGLVTFTYLGDIWTADERGGNIRRLTAHRARDMMPRFSPDGRWIAFSSDREGNFDVWVIPVSGGLPRQLTFHSADDTVLGWTPDGSAVLFASNRSEDFLGTLYLVPLDGGAEMKAGTDYGMYGSFSPDGTKLAVNRKGQSYWRKGYRGAYQTDVTVVDLKSRTFRDLTDFSGMDTWPMWSTDGWIYFVSDRDAGAQANLWKVPATGGQAVRVTQFTDGEVRFPAMSADGRTIVFERDFRIWKLDLASGQAGPIFLEIDAEPQDTLVEYRTISGEVDDYDAAPGGRQIVAAVRGELFLVPTGDDGELRQLTRGPARDRNVEFSPDGRQVAFVSDLDSFREEIYVLPADGSAPPRRVTDLDCLKTSYTWSPDSRQLAVATSDGKLYRVAADGSSTELLVSCKYGSIGRPAWSPDGSLLAFSMPDVTRTDDIYLLPSQGGEPRKITFDSASDRSPAFSADGKKVYFLRLESGDQSERPQSALMVVPLEKQERDPDEPADGEDAQEAQRRQAEARRSGENGGPQPLQIDWAGLKRRTRNVLRTSGGRGGRGGSSSGGLSVVTFTPGRDGRTVVFAASSGTGSGISLYSCTDDGRNLRTLATTTPTTTSDEGDGTPRGSGGFFRGGIGNLRITRDGRTLFYQQGNGVYTLTLGGGVGSGTALAGGRGGFGRGGGSPAASESSTPSASGSGGRRINFTVTLTIDKPAEWQQMFADAWRTMKYRFYDPKLHGTDWLAIRAKYEPIVAHVADRQELMNLINEMIGELNASHTGASASRSRDSSDPAAAVQTVHLGIDLVPDIVSGRYRVAHIYEGGPADKDWINISVGDYLLAIDDQPVLANDNLWRLLNNRRLNRKVKLTLNRVPGEAGAWTVRYEPISWATFANLRYERWVQERRELTDRLSGGRVGYVHIRAMDQTSLRRFEKELRENRHKEALVIDQRFNGGGNIEQELLGILVQRPYQVWQPRGTEPTDRPLRGHFGPKIVLQNWRSASNAEMFPAGFRALGLGKLVGTPTMGAVIGTGSYSLIDGSTIRTPSVGVYLADPQRTNMENYGVQPDILVENTPEDNLAGRDRQLEVAVQELLRQLPTQPPEILAGSGGSQGTTNP
jgi:tricorn protease